MTKLQGRVLRTALHVRNVTSEQEPEAEMAGDTEVVVSEPVETFRAETPLKKVLPKAPQSDRNTKYVASHLRARVAKESEEFSQIRRRVRARGCGMNLRDGLSVEGILIRGLKWSKLVDPDKKGQWWLSGDMASTTSNFEVVASTIDKESLEAQKLLQLAAVQRMNTDVRRAIFCVIMSGEDYVDAFEKLLRLDLQGKQDREIMRVLVECILQEQIFNKYYSVLAIKLCSHDKNHKITLQYCLWDHLKGLESMQLMRSMHLSKFVAEMVTTFTLSLAVLKAVDFSDTTQLTPKRIKHFQMLFKAIFEHPDSLVWNVFTRIAGSPKYESLRNGVEFFINKYVVGNENSLARKFKIAKKAFTNIEGVLM
ncbi:unnamed protein product [Camellia sinensis]